MTRKKLWLIGGAATAVVLFGLVLASGILIKPFLEYKIRQNGFPKANIETVTVIPRGILLEKIYLDAEGFSTIDAVQVTASWFDLILHKKIQAITLKDVEVSGELDEQGHFVIAGWDASPLTGDGSSSMTMQNINVDGLTVDFETPEGAIRAEGKLTLQQKVDGSRDFQASLWGKQKQLSLTVTADGSILTSGAWSATLEINDGRLDLAGLKASRASGKANLAGGNGTPLTYSGQFSAGGLRIKDIPFQDTAINFDSKKTDIVHFKTNPTGYSDIVVEGNIATGDAAAISASIAIKDMKDVTNLLELKKADMMWLNELDPITLKLEAPLKALSEPKISAMWAATIGKAQQRLDGSMVLDREQHLISGTLKPFKISGAELSNLFPLKAQTGITVTGGTLSTAGTFAYDYEVTPAKVTGDLTLKADRVAGLWEDYLFDGVNGTIKLTQLYPWEIKNSQSITVKTIGTGINLTDGAIELRGAQSSGTVITKAAFVFGGGRLATEPFTWKTNAKDNTMTVNLENVDLSVLTQSIDAEGFAAEGHLNGSLPVVFTPEGLIFKEGTISSSDAGLFKYTPAAYPAALRGDDTRMETVRRALSDFRYSSLEISIGGELNGDLKTSLKATGHNPVFGERPINLNINLEGALMPALQQALQPGRIASTIEKSITGDR